jgi:hypothetical protein
MALFDFRSRSPVWSLLGQERTSAWGASVSFADIVHLSVGDETPEVRNITRL